MACLGLESRFRTLQSDHLGPFGEFEGGSRRRSLRGTSSGRKGTGSAHWSTFFDALKVSGWSRLTSSAVGFVSLVQ